VSTQALFKKVVREMLKPTSHWGEYFTDCFMEAMPLILDSEFPFDRDILIPFFTDLTADQN